MQSSNQENSSAPLPVQWPTDHSRLFSMAQPYLQHPHQIADFRFFEPSILLVRSGQLTLRHQQNAFLQLDNAEHLVVVAQHTLTNVSKRPDAEKGFFSSLYLGFSPAVIAAFYRDHSALVASLAPLTGFKTVPLDDELRDTLEHCLRGIGHGEQPLPSPAVQQHRLTGILIALAERGVLFMPRSSEPLSSKLTALMSAAPEFAWTAASASQQLAMSEATLRRRLVEEQTSFRTLLQDIRMHHAMTLLQTTRWSLSQIADACGYRASSRFSLRFKQRFGCSPADIR